MKILNKYYDRGELILGSIIALLFIGMVLLALFGPDPVQPCSYNFSVTWDSGGYAAATGWIKASEVEILPSGVVQGKTTECAWFSLSPGDITIEVREVK